MVARMAFLAGAILLSSSAVAAPKVAVVYSAWPNGGYAFKSEMDAHLQHLGWEFEAFENTAMATLIPRLREFDIVISAGVGNYENPVDMAQYAAEWLAFLNNGGALWITDASYGSVLDLWVNRLGPDFVLTTTTCASHRRDIPDPDRREFNATDPFLKVPVDLVPLLAAKTNIWAHLDSWGPDWRSLVTCADDRSLFLLREAGKGCLMVTSYFSFRGNADTPLVAGLLTNLWTHVQGLRAGIALTELSLGEALPGKHRASLGLSNATAEPVTCDVRLGLSGEAAGRESSQAASVTIPAGAEAVVRLPYTLPARGEAVFDIAFAPQGGETLSLRNRQEIPPLLSVSVPNRHVYPWHQEIPLNLAFAPEKSVKLAECSASILVDDQLAVELAAIERQMTVNAPCADLEPGQHRVVLALKCGDEVLGTAEAAFTKHDTPRVYTRFEDGTAMVDGQPFFPFGWYHVSWPFPAEDRLQFLREVAEAGFNTVHASLKQMDEWDEFLAEAERLNMKVITEFGVPREQAIARYRDRKAVLAWNPGDEPDGGGVDPAEMSERHNLMKDQDPQVPTYMTLCVPPLFSRYVHAADVIAPDPYPIRHGPSSTAPVFQTVSSAQKEAWKYRHPIWAIPQAFGYDKETGWRVPTWPEERNMTYLALMAGAKGIIYYTYRDNGFNMREHPDLWENFKTLPPEIEAMKPYLLEGTRTVLVEGENDIYATHWAYEGRHLICVASTANTETREVSISLPEGVTGQLRNLFPDRPGGMTMADGTLSGTIGPLDVHVYEVG